MDKSGNEMGINCLYSRLIISSKNSCKKFPHSDEETTDNLPCDTRMWVVGSGQDTVILHPIDTLLILLGAWKYRQLLRVSGCSVLVSLLTFPSLMWALKSQGMVSLGFFLTAKIWFLHQPHPIPYTQWAPHCQLTSDTISLELMPMPQVEVSRLSWLQMPPMWFESLILLTK